MSLRHAIGFYSAPAASYPAALANRHFWYDPSDLSIITKDGGDIISRFNDKLGNGNDLVAGSALWTADTVLYNGTSQYLRTGVIAAMTQPFMVYVIMKQVTWTYLDRIWTSSTTGGNTSAGANTQYVSSPEMNFYSGESLNNNELALDTWGIVRVLYNGANSKVIINDGTPQTGNLGTINGNGFTIAAQPNGALPSKIQHKDFIVMPSTEGEAEIYNWLVTRI